jgi:adenylate kinase family enzyme
MSSLAETHGMQRISVVGNSGSGKTSVAKAIAAERGLPYLELDSVFHQPDWQPLFAWTNHRRLRARYESAQADPENAHLTFVRLRTPEETAALFRDLAVVGHR